MAAAYWTTTSILATECLVGGVMGALQLSPFRDTAMHLGYPGYFMSILGAWYVAAGVVLVAGPWHFSSPASRGSKSGPTPAR
jgi:hypothetical protein